MPVHTIILVAALTLIPALSNAEVNASLAGQSIVRETSGGQYRKEYAQNGQLIYEVLEERKRETEDGSRL